MVPRRLRRSLSFKPSDAVYWLACCVLVLAATARVGAAEDRDELTGAEYAKQFFEETPHLKLAFVQWAPGDEPLELVSQTHSGMEYPPIDRGLDLLRREGLRGTAIVRRTGRYDVGRDSRVIVVMHRPLDAWVSLKLPDTSETVVLLQDGDSFRVLPANIPRTDRNLEIGRCEGSTVSRGCYFVQRVDSVVPHDTEIPGGHVIPAGTVNSGGKNGGGIGIREPFADSPFVGR